MRFLAYLLKSLLRNLISFNSRCQVVRDGGQYCVKRQGVAALR